MRELADARLGFSIVARGPVLFTEATRVAMLSELDASRAVIGSDLVRLPEGERLTERQIFVDPVVAHPEEALESRGGGGARGGGDGTRSGLRGRGGGTDGRGGEHMEERIERLKSFVAKYAAKYAGGGD